MSPSAAWIYALMVWLLPPAKAVEIVRIKDAIETEAERDARYRSIASDLATVVYDPTETPVFSGPKGRAQTATLLLGLTYLESGWRKDVDTGKGPHARGDRGRSWCLGQINIGRRRTQEGWSGPELVRDRPKCLRAVLHAVRQSYNACRRNHAKNRLAAYTSGDCTAGQPTSAARVSLGQRLFARLPAPPDAAAGP